MPVIVLVVVMACVIGWMLDNPPWHGGGMEGP